MLYGANTLLGFLKTSRVCWLRGRYGSGKTALAHRIGYELISSGSFRYLISNCRSVWADNPADVVLREGRFVDAVLILDEAGMFVDGSYKARKYLAFLRKLNVCVLLSSFLKPAAVMRDFSIKRFINWEIAGLPVWSYRYLVSDGVDRYSDVFHWVNPSEIYDIYDTAGFPSDDAGIEDWLLTWTKAAAKATGYTYNPYGGLSVTNGESSALEILGGIAASIEEAAAQNADSLSIHLNNRKGRR